MKADRKSVYEKVTDRIVAALEAGVAPWAKPWVGGASPQPLRHGGQPYRGVNVLVLWATAEERGYISPYWLTYKQVEEYKGHVRKGEHGAHVTYASTAPGKADPETGEKGKGFFFMKGYTVFNADQCDGLPERFYAKPVELPPAWERIEAAERFFAATGATIHHAGTRAFYNRATDEITVPPREYFKDGEAHAGTVAHELIHWTGAEQRLNRAKGKTFGDDVYAFEELIAEIGAAFTNAALGIEAEPSPEHASYLACWIKTLKADSRAIFTAASQAQKAADYLAKLAGVAAEPEAVEA